MIPLQTTGTEDHTIAIHRNRRTQSAVRHCQSCTTSLPLLKPKVLYRSREKVIVFSFCFWSFAFTMFSSILGDCTSEQIPGKCSPLLHCTTILCSACSACCLRCWQLYRADVEAKKAELKWRRRQLMWRRRIIMKASTKAKLHA